MKPTHYTAEEGGCWEPWPQDQKMPPGLLKQTGVWYVVLTTPGLPYKIHALAFDDPAGMDFGEFRRWDCYNGWTTRRKWTETKK